MISANLNRLFTVHRGWEDFCSAGVGLLIVLSPVLLGADASTAVAVNAGLIGVIIAALALLEFVQLQRWEEVSELALGAWMVLSPYVLQYGGTLRDVHIALGGLVVAFALLELWQDRKRA